jgi:hypothetical protein
MAKIYFGRPGTKPNQADFKGQKEISWCQNNLGSLTFHSPLGKMPKTPDEESQVPPEFRNYKLENSQEKCHKENCAKSKKNPTKSFIT